MIRPARPSDADAWLGLRAELWPEESPEDAREEIARYFVGTNETLAAVFLATDEDDVPCGFAEFSIRPYVPGAEDTSAPFLEGWFVSEAERGKGIGRALIAAGERWAVRSGHRQLGSDVLIGNVEGDRAHEGVGFRPVEQVTFYIKDLGAEARG